MGLVAYRASLTRSAAGPTIIDISLQIDAIRAADVVDTFEAFKRRDGAIVVFCPCTTRCIGGACVEFAVVKKRLIGVEIGVAVDGTYE